MREGGKLRRQRRKRNVVGRESIRGRRKKNRRDARKLRGEEGKGGMQRGGKR